MWVYKITNTANNKILIGQTIQNPPINRWKAHKYRLNKNCHYNSHFQNAWNKYGRTCFIFEIIGTASSLEELNNLEILEIQKNNSMNPSIGYNKLSGGENERASNDTREKHRNRMNKLYQSGWIHPMTGRHHSDIARRRMTIHRKNYFKTHAGFTKGIPCPLERKNKLIKLWDIEYPPIISPFGDIIYINNIRNFCRENNYNDTFRRALGRVFSGEYKQYKGWYLTPQHRG